METLIRFVILSRVCDRLLHLDIRPGSGCFPGSLRHFGPDLWPLRLTLWQMMSVVAMAAFLILAFEKWP